MRRKRRKKNPFDFGLISAPLALVATAASGILGMSAADKQAKAARDEQNRIEMLRRGEVEKQQVMASVVAENERQRILFEASQSRRNQTIAILAGVGGFAALMGVLFISAANKKG